jgi:hypothetical protein
MQNKANPDSGHPAPIPPHPHHSPHKITKRTQSRFRTLPAPPRDNPSPPLKINMMETSHTPTRVLIVDDEESQRTALAAMVLLKRLQEDGNAPPAIVLTAFGNLDISADEMYSVIGYASTTTGNAFSDFGLNTPRRSVARTLTIPGASISPILRGKQSTNHVIANWDSQMSTGNDD